MSADKTRVSRAVRGVDGGTDSHADLNPPNAAARKRSRKSRQHHPAPIAATAQVQETQITTTLSDAQREAFWAGILANLDAARRAASRIVRREDVDDVVHNGAVRFIESLEGPEPSSFPATDGELRARYLDIVRRYAIDCVRDSKRPPLQTHSNWGMECEPVVRGHNVPDRPLGSVFARNDKGKYDAPAARPRREQDSVEQLRHILDRHLDMLSQAQREIVVESSFNEGKRADIAARRGITLSTYDNHRQAAFKALRASLAAEVEASTGTDRSIWYDRIAELIERRAARLGDGSSSKKGKTGNLEGKAGTPRGKGDNLEGKRDKPEGKRDNPRDERRSLEGKRDALTVERADPAHEGDDSQRETDTGGPETDRSVSAPSDSGRRRPRIVRRSAQPGRRTRLPATETPRSAA